MSADVNTTAPSSVDELAPGMEVRGRVKRIELYGAFVDIGVGVDGLLHVSQLGRSNVRNVEDVVKAGQEVTAYILRVEKAERRIALSLVKPPAMSWDDLKEGQTVTGTVQRLEKFGVFVDIGAERPGMIHVSELASGFVNAPSDVVKQGDQVTARIIKLNRRQKRIDLSLKAMEEPVVMPQDEPEDDYIPTAMELALRRAMEGGSEQPQAPQPRKKDKQNKRAQELDDIIERTLRGHSNG